ncbi:unnamed protein product [Cylindrotheca closterium]|uniref:F-box domain-containing protein n=1 Tax=Cylindrotheca closterium TaxID=2856 RepID=A0AAD2PWP8_9STRA|nr:unnamed protein product [Cylindrotheca closterium]
MKSFTRRVLRKPSFRISRRKKKKQKDVATKSPPTLEDLPVELKQQMASFLSVRDLLNLKQTSKCMNGNLGICVISLHLGDRVSQSKIFETVQSPKYFAVSTQCFAAAIPNQESYTYATTISCNLGTNGFGAIWVVEQDLPKMQTLKTLESRGFRSGKIIDSATTTSSRKLVLEFFPKVGKFYQFWINARRLENLHNIELHSVGVPMRPSDHTILQFDIRLQIPRDLHPRISRRNPR